jgi:hypothetical protein
MPFDKVLTQANNNSYSNATFEPSPFKLAFYNLPFIITFEPSPFTLVAAFYCKQLVATSRNAKEACMAASETTILVILQI